MGFVQPVVDFFKFLVQLGQPANLQKLVNLGGPLWVSYVLLFLIIFSETGLLIGFFLPGDSLLFTAGLLASQRVFDILALNVTLMVAAIIGDAANYTLGLKMTENVFEKGKLRFVKHEHLLAARDFYNHHGNIAIVLARFVPFVRTFTPFVAGVARMEYRKFVAYNIAGGVGWVFSMTMLGYFLGQIPFVILHFEKFVLGIVAISLLPLVFAVFRKWRGRHTSPQSRTV